MGNRKDQEGEGMYNVGGDGELREMSGNLKFLLEVSIETWARR